MIEVRIYEHVERFTDGWKKGYEFYSLDRKEESLYETSDDFHVETGLIDVLRSRECLPSMLPNLTYHSQRLLEKSLVGGENYERLEKCKLC